MAKKSGEVDGVVFSEVQFLHLLLMLVKMNNILVFLMQFALVIGGRQNK